MIEGFKEFYIRNVPMGQVLSKETAHLYELVPSGRWYSSDLKYFIQDEADDTYSIHVNSNDSRDNHFKKYYECPEHNSFWHNSSLEKLTKLYNKYLK